MIKFSKFSSDKITRCSKFHIYILFNAFVHPLVYTGLYSLERGNFSSCTRSTADCRHVSLTPLHSNSCSRCRVSTLRTHAIGATAGDLPAQLHASYTANAKWQLAGPPSLLARNYKQTLSRMGIIDQRGRVDFYRRGMIAISNDVFNVATVDHLENNSLLDFKYLGIEYFVFFFFFNLFSAADKNKVVKSERC